jgi:hypothetical protein
MTPPSLAVLIRFDASTDDGHTFESIMHPCYIPGYHEVPGDGHLVRSDESEVRNRRRNMTRSQKKIVRKKSNKRREIKNVSKVNRPARRHAITSTLTAITKTPTSMKRVTKVFKKDFMFGCFPSINIVREWLLPYSDIQDNV